MKLSAVGNTNAVLFEPENKREAKQLNDYVSNKEFMETKKAKTNLGVGIGSVSLSYLSMAIATLAKKKGTRIGAAIVAFASMATSIGFAVKQMIDLKKFKEGPVEEQPQQIAEQATTNQTTQA